MYELFILSKLLHRPMHGYLLQTIVNFAIGPFRRLSWGTLYPLMKRLEENGYIVEVDPDEDDPRGKKRYRTTQMGRARFLELMNDSGEENAQSADLFRIKIGCFGHIDSEARLRILKDYRNYLAEVLAHSVRMSKQVGSESGLPPDEKRFALLGLDHQRTAAEAELLWVDSTSTLRNLLNPPQSNLTVPNPRKARRTRERA
jgi:DNA-binding PadR family transcriptional regulator